MMAWWLVHWSVQAIIWPNVGILLIGPQETNFCEILIEIDTFSYKKMHLKCHLENGDDFVMASRCLLLHCIEHGYNMVY